MNENICLDCGKEVGNNVFTICDGCWDKRDMIKLKNDIQQLEQALDLAIRWIDGQIEMSEQQIVSKLHDAKQAREK